MDQTAVTASPQPVNGAKPMFSVIIPTFNRQAMIETAIESVLAQRFTDYELIVVDDGSTDGTAGMVRKFGNRVKLLEQKNQGPGAARNLGLAHARGDYVAFLDSDDLWFPWTLATYEKVIRENDWPDFIAVDPFDFVAETQLALITPEPLSVSHWKEYLQAAVQGYYVGAGRCVVRTSVIQNIGGFARQRINCEDHDLTLRLGMVEGFVWIHKPAVLARRRHEQNVSLDMSFTYAGIVYLVEQEKAGKYPGGPSRQKSRRSIICLHARSASFNCLAYGQPRLGRRIYRLTFKWQLQLNRWKYLLGFPIRALFRSWKGQS